MGYPDFDGNLHRGGALELISSQPSSALPPSALPCEVGMDMGVAEDFVKKLGIFNENS